MTEFKFKEGDKVVDLELGHGIVFGVDVVNAVRFVDGSEWQIPERDLQPKPADRIFKPGDHVRIIESDQVGFVYFDDGDDENNAPYSVLVYGDDGGEEIFSSCDLMQWKPRVGERVVVVGDPDEVGTITVAGQFTARVMWDDYPNVQTWPIEDLEPADEAVHFQVNDRVIYSSPYFNDEEHATVKSVGDETIEVIFDNPRFQNGRYSNDFFEKLEA